MGFERFCRIASFFFRGESAIVRSIRKSIPIKSSAVAARFGSDVIALKKYRRQCAQQFDLLHVAARVEVVVDRVRVGDEVAAVAGEHVVDGVAVVAARVLEEHVPLRRDEHPEVARAAFAPCAGRARPSRRCTGKAA